EDAPGRPRGARPGELGRPREAARSRRAAPLLVALGLLEGRGYGGRILRVREESRVAEHLRERGRAGRDDDGAGRHRLEGREPEALVEARIGEESRAGQERERLLGRDPSEAA